MGAAEVTTFLTSLAVEGRVAASTQNQALSALLFLYRNVLASDLPWLEGLVRAKRPARLPVVLTREEVRAVLTRYACKMATGSGKTVVMGMVIAWQVLNKLANPKDRRFSHAVLLVCPNLTIRERLQVLLPWKPGNYYDKFDLVPRGLLERLQQGKFEVTNWHLFQPQDHSSSRSVV
jgi:type III restriction enzyme